MIKISKLALVLITIISQNYLFAQSIDNGFSSDYHKNHPGTIVFSNKPVAFQKEDPALFKSDFNWGDPIYSRNYMKSGLVKDYADLNWDATETYYFLEVYANGNLINWYFSNLDPKWTTFQSGYYQADDDNDSWNETSALWNNLAKLKAGKNKIDIKVFSAKADRQKGNLMCEGSFNLNVKKESIEQAKIILFVQITTRWSGSDAWKEWVVSFNRFIGSLKTRWSGNDAWKEWVFSIAGSEGTIRTRWSGDDAWKEWIYTGSNGTINIKTRWSGDDAWNEWIVTGSKVTLNTKTRWSGNDASKEWVITGPNGTIIVKTRWGGDDAWKDWLITDNMPDEDIDLKMAAIFPCIIAGAVIK